VTLVPTEQLRSARIVNAHNLRSPSPALIAVSEPG
jgi:hypothetical protein